MDNRPAAAAVFEFSRYAIFPQRREVLADGQPMELGGRAFDVLLALIEADGAVVAKGDLLRRVWPDRIVDDNNLHVQIRALRRAFAGDDFIRTVVGRGYQFRGAVRPRGSNPGERALSAAGSENSAQPPPPTNLPLPISDLIGRDDNVEEVIRLSLEHRLVTLTGPGGIGKTRLALEVARHLPPRFVDGVWLAELASLADPRLVPATVGAVFGLQAGTASAERVAATLGSKQILLLLDNCEHVIVAAAAMAEALLHANPAVRIIATSREPLRAESEHLYHVPPLAVPKEDGQALEDLLGHGAAALFVARARALDTHFSPDHETVAAIAAICQHLDGIPLALELAAARVSTMGLQQLASRLDDRFSLLTQGRRTALRRHHTLRATLDWSYELLPETERLLLRHLSIFAGTFTLAAANAVVAGTGIRAADVIDGLGNLVNKSLVAPDVEGPTVHYRLLETTRAYAREKLAELRELEPGARRHAEYYREFCAQAEAEWQTRPAAEWQAEYGSQIDNVRAALDWTLSPGGDTSIGIALTAAAVPLWCQLSLLDECRRRVEQALSHAAGSSQEARYEMQLEAALGLALFHTKGTMRQTGAAWMRSLAIADSLGEPEYQLRALWGLWSCRMASGEYRGALVFAQRFRRLAARQPDRRDRLIGERMIGSALHYLGDFTKARRHIDRMLGRYVDPLLRSHTIRFVWDQRIAAEIVLAMILWLQGYPDQAVRAAQRTVERARARDHAISLCYTLASAACQVALWVGDLAAAEAYVLMLLDHSTKFGMAVWLAEGHCLEGVLQLKRGRYDTGVRQLRRALDELSETGSVARYSSFLGAQAEGFARTGEVVAGLAAIAEALERSENSEANWCIAELLRIKAELLLLEGMPDAAAAAEKTLFQALGQAHRQGALSWELRAATSLARMWHGQGRNAEAQQLLAAVYRQFTEGFETADLRTAKGLLDGL